MRTHVYPLDAVRFFAAFSVMFFHLSFYSWASKDSVVGHMLNHATAFPAATVKSAHALWIAFLKREPTGAATAALAALRCPTDEFHVRGREVYWLRHATSSESKFTGSLDKILGMPVTARNITTVRKLAGM